MARIDDVREIVEKVLGWRYEPFFGWDPYRSASAALDVVQAMRKRHNFAWSCGICPEMDYVSFFSREDQKYKASGTFCESICAAALAAIREGQ